MVFRLGDKALLRLQEEVPRYVSPWIVVEHLRIVHHLDVVIGWQIDTLLGRKEDVVQKVLQK